MSLLNNSIHFNFFNNKEFNQFYISIFIMTFGESLINIFVPIYLFNLGYEIYQIIIFYFLVSLYFLVFSYTGAKLVGRMGEKHSILVSTVFIITYYLGLIFINKYVILFYILPLLLSLRMILFNYGYHLNYINHSQRKKRGKELAFIGVITLLSTTSAPLIGSVIADINFTFVFIASSLLLIIGTVPLFFTKDSYEKVNFTFEDLTKKLFSKKDRGNFISFSGYAVESIIGRMIWPIFLIMIIGSIFKTGLIISLTLLISLLIFYFMGKITDKYNKIKLIKIGTILYFFAWIGRIFADTYYKILFIDSYKNLSEKIVHIPWSSQSYDLAEKEDYFCFIVSREIIFNFIRILIMPILSFIFWINYNPFFISFLIAAIFSLGYVFIKKE